MFHLATCVILPKIYKQICKSAKGTENFLTFLYPRCTLIAQLVQQFTRGHWHESSNGNELFHHRIQYASCVNAIVPSDLFDGGCFLCLLLNAFHKLFTRAHHFTPFKLNV